MSRQNIRINIGTIFRTADMPILALSGAVMGFLTVGVLYMMMGGLMDVPDGCLWNGKALLAGLSCVGISLAITAFIFIYWNLVVKKRGVIAPALFGFGFILALLGFASAIMLGAELVVCLSN